jgi:hypothetical protein
LGKYLEVEANLLHFHIGNLKCNDSHVPPNIYSVMSHTGLVESMSPSYGQTKARHIVWLGEMAIAQFCAHAKAIG